MSSENTVGKGEIARCKQFLLFPQCFLPIWMDFLPVSSNLKLLSANSFSLEKSLKFIVLERVKPSSQPNVRLVKSVAQNVKSVFQRVEKVVEKEKILVLIHQPFSRTSFVFFSKICKFEYNTPSDWPIGRFVIYLNASLYRKIWVARQRKFLKSQ